MSIPFYMLLRTLPEKSHYVAHETLKIEGVKVSHSVVGNYDVILYAEGKDFEDLRRIRLAIEQIKFLTATETLMHA
jgi:uncharacterized protein with GYD domain